VKANGKILNPPATKMPKDGGWQVFQRVSSFQGRSDPIEVVFTAISDKGERRCTGSIQVQSLGPR
jgi:hypothetical protein